MATQQENPDKGIPMIRAVAGAIAFGFVLSLGSFIASDAQADKYVNIMQSKLTSAIDGSKAEPLKFEIVGRCIKGVVYYKVTNRGGDWPKYSFLGIYRTGFANPVLAKRLKMKKGETKTFRIKFGDKPIRKLEFKFQPYWLKREFIDRFKHTPHPDDKP